MDNQAKAAAMAAVGAVVGAGLASGREIDSWGWRLLRRWRAALPWG